MLSDRTKSKRFHMRTVRVVVIQSLRKPRRQRQGCETKDLMRRTKAMRMRYNSLNISLPSSAKQQREMTKFCVAGERELRQLIFKIYISN